MRIAFIASMALVILGLPLAVKAETGSAGARNFGSVTCAQSFDCSQTANFSTYASSCAASGLHRAADFTSATSGSDGCLSPSNSGGSGSSGVVCCPIPASDQGNLCRMQCSIMVKGSSN